MEDEKTNVSFFEKQFSSCLKLFVFTDLKKNKIIWSTRFTAGKNLISRIKSVKI